MTSMHDYSARHDENKIQRSAVEMGTEHAKVTAVALER